MKIALTGASGLLGSNLAHLLCDNGHELQCLRRPTSYTSHLNDLPMRWCTGDLGDTESLVRLFSGARVVIHCAALVGCGAFMGRQMHRTNVEGTRNVIAAVRAAGVERLVHCSSVDALGLPAEDDFGDEETPWNWDRYGVGFEYPRTKYESEQLVLRAAESDIDAVVVNPTFMVGPFDMKPSSGKLLLHIVKSALVMYPSGANNFVDVRDVSRGVLLAMERGTQGERYILGGENLSYRDFYCTVATCAGRKQAPLPLMPILAHAAGRAGDLWSNLAGRQCDLNSEVVALASLRHCFRSEKAVRELGYSSGPVLNAVRDALEWFLNSKNVSVHG